MFGVVIQKNRKWKNGHISNIVQARLIGNSPASVHQPPTIVTTDSSQHIIQEETQRRNRYVIVACQKLPVSEVRGDDLLSSPSVY